MNYFTIINWNSRVLLQGLNIVFFILLSSLALASPVLSQTIHGKVIKVADGDTITILTNQNKQVKIRLYGIDTPEKRQAYGNKAKRFTANLVAGKNVSVKVYDTDRYGRLVGVIHVGDTTQPK